ncbi:MAG: Rne/Rng family ribonuclease [Cytophagales bacterium]|nr:Rne/Rng family ribonuclease [Bernardetiaceae bacterium]MDW8210357.1 Rne/Rng family ribonuclease [Cytophagales bacterium]
MSNELVINSTQNGGRIALLRDKSLVEFHYDTHSGNFVVGDIFLGVVRRIIPGLNAAFIDIGYEKDAFLHYLDLGPNFRSLQKFVRIAQNSKLDKADLKDFKMEPPLDKLGKISDVLKVNQPILVQVVKEPISTKGPRLSCELSIAGRHLVLVPFANSVNVSKKVTDSAERKRLIRLLSSIKPENFGIIVRTVAEGKDIADFEKDLDELLGIWQKGVEKLHTARPREKIIGEMGKANSMLRDMLNETFDSITVDDREMYEEIKAFIRNIAPEKEKIVKLYTGKAKIFEAFGIEKQVKLLFGPTVSLPSGGYIVIEHTEALHVIDVNSGNKSVSESNQESTAFAVNMEAATEIARQLRLRDMGGIIVIDFIDMKSPEHKRMLYEHMKAEMKSDRAKFTILPLTKFGLMQITRQRVRPELNISTLERCPTCNGTGKINASISVADQIESKIDYILTRQNERGITLVVHPYLYAYFTAGWPSIRLNWFFKYRRWVRIEKDSSLGVTEFHIKNQHDQLIEL